MIITEANGDGGSSGRGRAGGGGSGDGGCRHCHFCRSFFIDLGGGGVGGCRYGDCNDLRDIDGKVVDLEKCAIPWLC
ncbi:Hypothetical predicted protein [Octopus vulgaris]|uniref:Uncharacterized protein n=1 Tax=Octopus vulgaris TaxID=6645 RepID=A0AA36F011_OCTVU|nr:Hypothetical predicted protein [Octopus vulgaris]